MLQKYKITAFVFVSLSAWGQKCDCFVRGTITDQDSKKAISTANIWIKELNKGTQSNSSGQYRLDGICQGKYTLIIRFLGYQEQQQSIVVEHGIEQNFELSEEAQHLESINIAAQKNETPTLGLARLSEADLRQKKGTTLAENLQSLAGLSILQTGSSVAKPVLHGMHSNRVLILNNGVRQEGQQWGSEHAPEIDPFVAKNISVLKGAASVRYGADAIAGVVLIEPEKIVENLPMKTEVNLVGFSNGRQGVASAQVAQAKNGFGWRLQGTWKRGGTLATPHYFLANTAVAEQNASATVNYRKTTWRTELFYSIFNTQIGIFKGAHIGSLSDLQNVISRGEPLPEIKNVGFTYSIARPNQAIKHQLLKSKTVYYLPKGGSVDLQVAYQHNLREEYDLHRPRCEACPELEFKLKTLTTDFLWEHRPLWQKISGQVGLSGIFQQNTRRFRPLIPDFNTVSGGLFLIERFSRKKTDWELGLRYDDKLMITYRKPKAEDSLQVSDFRFKNWSLSFGGEHHFEENWHLRFNVGSAWRSPNVSELMSRGVHHGAASYEEGDTNLGLEKAYNTNLNLTFKNRKYAFEVDFYLNYIHNYIFLQPQPNPVLTIRGAFPSFRHTQTDAVFRGIDLMNKYLFSPRFSWKTKGTLLWVWDLRNDNYLVGIPPQRVENTWEYRTKNQKIGFELQHIGVAKQNRVEADQDYSPSPPAYQLFNVLANIEISKKVSCNLSVQNVFNTSYRDYMNRFRYFAEEQGRNIVLRLIFLK